MRASVTGSRTRQSSGRLDFLGALVAQGASAPLAFAANLIFARLLSPASFGLYITLLSAALVAGALAAYGVGPVLTREIATRPVLLPTITRWAVRLTGTLSLAIVACLLVWLSLGTNLGAPNSTWAERAITVLIVPTVVLLVLISGQLSGLTLVAKSTSLSNFWKNGFLLIGASALLLTDGAQVEAALWVQVVASIGAAAIGVYWLRKATATTVVGVPRDLGASSGEGSRSMHRKWRQAAGHFFAISAATLMLGRLDVIIVNALSGPTEAGLFGAAARLGQVAGIVGHVWMAWLQPRVRQLIRDKQHAVLNSVLRRGFVGAVTMTVGLVAIAWFLGPLLVTLMGKSYAGALLPFRWLVLGYIVWAAAVPSYAFLAMIGHESTLSKILWVQTAVTIAASFPLVRSHGALGGAWAWAGGMALGSLCVIGVCAVYRARHGENAE